MRHMILLLLWGLSLPSCKDKPAGSYTEAREAMHRLARGAKAYFETERVSAQGVRLPCQFPDSVALTPKGSACSQKDRKFKTADGQWGDHRVWSALLFRPRGDSHHFRYKFIRGKPSCRQAPPVGGGLRCVDSFTVVAVGDLDCDGVTNTYYKYAFGYANPGTKFTTDCEMTPSSRIYAGDYSSITVAGQPATDPLTGQANDYFDQGMAFMKQSRYRDALAKFDQAVKLKPDLVAAHHNKGLCYVHLDRFGEAVQAFARAAELDPLNPQLQLKVGRAALLANDLETAKAQLEKLKKLDQGLAGELQRDVDKAVGSPVSGRVRFLGGATISLPKSAHLVGQPTLPANLRSSRIFKLPNSSCPVLMINELKTSSKDCQTLIEGEIQQEKKNSQDKMLQLIARTEKVERCSVQPAVSCLYQEGKHRSAQEAEENRPFHPTVSYMLCKGTTAIIMVCLSDKATTSQMRAELEPVARSFR